jgi:hypothetical protein
MSIRPFGGVISLLRDTRRARNEEHRQGGSELSSHQILLSTTSLKASFVVLANIITDAGKKSNPAQEPPEIAFETFALII